MKLDLYDLGVKRDQICLVMDLSMIVFEELGN